MKKFLLTFFCFYGLVSSAQKIRFEYDAAGNQILRTWCPSCDSRMNNNQVKDITEIEDSDLQKFFPEDVISYYPNPVKEELYLKWDLKNNTTVSSIEVFSLNGQLIKTIKENLSQNTQLISFLDFPVGVYFISLNYSNGEQKSIKIVKN
ncbi:T9SS type A sorting domain-containing protein [Flavobacterium azooxidireducens]|uniref:T9SS type A sorting domain-containing protein n=1 Tax=Flavobacterium azooxidireducens TaxID=1871076 RepID=A0ABY4KHR1_9FLAO|nr:T9SS type A sorting domain-containing protein [Flavobacterium azooxidireducens]UPQ80326.1 T9SS type A sorting domain-containing protein [Flavobacterium azooxidireducens]